MKYDIEFVQDKDAATVEASTRADAFKKAKRKFDATPRSVRLADD